MSKSIVASSGRGRTALLLAALAVVFSLIVGFSVVSAQRTAEESIYVGDTVVVVGESVEPAPRAKPGPVPKKGSKLHVTEVQGEWISGRAEVDGKRQIAWLRRKDVRLDSLSPDAPATAVPATQPDDAQAVTALQKLGAKLELTDKGFVFSVDATESTIANTDLVHLRGLRQLTSLDLSGRPLTDEGIKTLAELKSLQELYLNDLRITDQSLAALKALVQLEILALQKTQVTGAGLANLKAMSHLLVLNLGHCAIGNGDLQVLQQHRLLEVLAIPGTKVTSAGMAHLKPLSRLRVLNLIGCAVDDSGLDSFRSLGNLRIVHIRGTQITAEGIEAIGNDYPELAFFQ